MCFVGNVVAEPVDKVTENAENVDAGWVKLGELGCSDVQGCDPLCDHLTKECHHGHLVFMLCCLHIKKKLIVFLQDIAHLLCKYIQSSLHLTFAPPAYCGPCEINSYRE